ncbi:hypothetical protein [Pedobacter gandavensis]|uniref:Uncharacterized protein n=1 Tax=Pedobacter gandavensis TaxID=2679963 RepID=A0ABR6EQ55_9SPHI|nr:hypothetical protein [Pedobacter gandavensis]MBB2147381.1 hypothetical protein [Pedobacter gandavensis]
MTIFLYLYKDLAQADLPITAESIKNKFQGKDTATHTLLEAVKNHNRKMKALVSKPYAIGTLKRFEILERHLQALMLEKYKITDIGIKEINHSFISDFEF